MRDKVISIFCLVDDILQGINHEEDKRRRVSDSEVLTTALVSAMYFYLSWMGLGQEEKMYTGH